MQVVDGIVDRVQWDSDFRIRIDAGGATGGVIRYRPVSSFSIKLSAWSWTSAHAWLFTNRLQPWPAGSNPCSRPILCRMVALVHTPSASKSNVRRLRSAVVSPARLGTAVHPQVFLHPTQGADSPTTPASTSAASVSSLPRPRASACRQCGPRSTASSQASRSRSACRVATSAWIRLPACATSLAALSRPAPARAGGDDQLVHGVALRGRDVDRDARPVQHDRRHLAVEQVVEKAQRLGAQARQRGQRHQRRRPARRHPGAASAARPGSRACCAPHCSASAT